MKRLYETPEMEIEKFTFPSNLITTSGGGLGEVGEEPDDPFGDGLPY